MMHGRQVSLRHTRVERSGAQPAVVPQAPRRQGPHSAAAPDTDARRDRTVCRAAGPSAEGSRLWLPPSAERRQRRTDDAAPSAPEAQAGAPAPDSGGAGAPQAPGPPEAGGGSGGSGPVVDPLERAAAAVFEFCRALEADVPLSALRALAAVLPAVVAAPPAETRAKLQALAAAVELPLADTAELVAEVPTLWERPPEAAAEKLAALCAELGVGRAAAARLLASQPVLLSLNVPGMAADRVERVAGVLKVSRATAADLIARQPLLWSLPPRDVRNDVDAVAAALGLTPHEAAELVVRMPLLLALEPQWLRLSIPAVAAACGLERGALAAAIVRHVYLVALEAPALGGALTSLGDALGGVGPEGALALLAGQPTLLVAQVPLIAGAVAELAAALQVPLGEALSLLVQQPSLLYEQSADSLRGRLEVLAAVFGIDEAAARQLALDQPVALVLAPSTLKAGLAAFGGQGTPQAAQVAGLLREDPGAFVAAAYARSNAADQWSARLGMSTQAVQALVTAQPALLEMAPTSLKARLESLAALFGAPSIVAAQLMLKHAALAAIPPNTTITRAKNLSVAAKLSMSGAAELIAKAPAAALALPPAALGPSGLAGELLDIGAAYEFYTLQWLQAAARERTPQRSTSLAGLHGGG